MKALRFGTSFSISDTDGALVRLFNNSLEKEAK